MHPPRCAHALRHGTQAAIAVLDTNQDQRLSLEEFRLLWARPLVEYHELSERNARAQSLFSAIDADGNGEIDYDELSHLAVLIGLDGSSVHDIWLGLGKGRNGTINFDEFRSVLSSARDPSSSHRPEV